MQKTHVCAVSTSLYTDLHQTFRKCRAISGLYWNYDGSLKGRCYGNRFLARVGENSQLLGGSQCGLLHLSTKKPMRSCGWLAWSGWIHIGKNTHVCFVFTGVLELMFSKISESMEQIMGVIIMHWNCDGLIKGRCYGNRCVAHVGENWHTPSSFCVLAFHDEWKNRNVDCCINTAIDPSTSDKNFVNFN